MAGSVGLQTFEVEQLLCQSWQGQRWGTCVLLLRTKCCRWHTPSLCTWSRREKSRFSVGLLNKQRHPGLILTKDEQQTARKHQAKQPLTTEQLGCNKSISEEQHQRGAASVRETTVRHRVEELAPNCQHPHHKKYLEIKGIMSDTVAPSLPLTPFTPPPTPPFFFFFFFLLLLSCHKTLLSFGDGGGGGDSSDSPSPTVVRPSWVGTPFATNDCGFYLFLCSQHDSFSCVLNTAKWGHAIFKVWLWVYPTLTLKEEEEGSPPPPPPSADAKPVTQLKFSVFTSLLS